MLHQLFWKFDMDEFKIDLVKFIVKCIELLIHIANWNIIHTAKPIYPKIVFILHLLLILSGEKKID